jgi:hypothetical protein
MKFHLLPGNLAFPDLLDEKGMLKLLPAAAYDQIPLENLMVWCHHHARYGLPTIELVDWLHDLIEGKKAIEIGSGSGDLARFLKIPATDNRMQEWPSIKLHYNIVGQPTIQYPDFVQNMDALHAIDCYKPDVVVASWITQWIDPYLPPPPDGGNIYGVKEDQIVERNCTYILVGNEKVHGKKKIMALPHTEHKLPFLRSRASCPELDRVWIWNEH